jgi:hypothetical protein
MAIAASAPQTLAVRVITGGIVAVGVVSGFRELLVGLVSEQWLRGDAAIAAVIAVRILAGAFGGLLAGAGRDNPAPIGLLTGAAASAAWAGIQIYGLKIPLGISDYLGLGVLMLVAAGAAALGCRIWPPKAELPKSKFPARGSSILENAKSIDEERKKLQPTHWTRVILGVSMTICGFVAAPLVRNYMAEGHFLDLGGARNVPFACLQIASFFAIIAAILAGAGTGIGLRQGVYTGLIAGGIAGAIYLARGPEKIPAGAGLVEVLGWSERSTRQQGAGAVFGGAFVIGSSGGIFGNLLFPPITKRRNKRRLEGQQVFAD